ncbi:hypothetical protein ACWDR1_30140 [Streptosporangium sandarakinum]
MAEDPGRAFVTGEASEVPELSRSSESANTDISIEYEQADSVFIFQTKVNISGLTEDGRIHFGTALQKLADELVREVIIIEGDSRPHDVSKPEVTASAVSQAFKALSERRRTPNQSQNQRSRIELSIQLIGMATLLFAGVMGSYLEEKWQVSLFSILAVLALICNGYTIWRRI